MSMSRELDEDAIREHIRDRLAEQQADALSGRPTCRAGRSRSTGSRSLAVDRIAVATAALFRVGLADLFGRSKAKSILEARLCAYYVARRCTRLSYPELGRAFGRDHSTVLSAVQRMGALVARDHWLGAAVAELCERFGEIEEEREQ